MQAKTELRGSLRYLAPVLCILFGGVIGLAGYYARIPYETRGWLRLGLCAVFLAGLFIFKRDKPAWHTSLAFLAVTAGLMSITYMPIFSGNMATVNSLHGR